MAVVGDGYNAYGYDDDDGYDGCDDDCQEKLRDAKGMQRKLPFYCLLAVACSLASDSLLLFLL